MTIMLVQGTPLSRALKASGEVLKWHGGTSSATEWLCQRGLRVTPGMTAAAGWDPARLGTPGLRGSTTAHLWLSSSSRRSSKPQKSMPRSTRSPLAPSKNTFGSVDRDGSEALDIVGTIPPYIAAFNAFSMKWTMLLKPYSQVSKLVTILEASCAFMHKYQETIERLTEFIKKPIYTHRDCAWM